MKSPLSAIASPVGLIWLTLLLWCYISISFKQRVAAVVAAMCLAILWGFGTFLRGKSISKKFGASVFSDFTLNDLEKLDAVVVLGGGTLTNINGEPQLGQSGDRVAMAAKVFRGGKSERVICTGIKAYRPKNEGLEIGEEAKAILIGLGIPSDSIETIAGKNTSQEMKAI